jgi:transcriptional regulator with XRE-family HTH domain
MTDRSRENVSEKIDHLFKTVRREDGREFTYDDVERGTQGRVSRSYVWKLRHGRNSNPSLDVIEAMARFFRVPPSYFFGPDLADDDVAREAAEVAALLQDESARRVATEARGLGPTSLSAVVDLIEHLRLLDEGGNKAASAGS